jgi:hypothetical protein
LARQTFLKRLLRIAFGGILVRPTEPSVRVKWMARETRLAFPEDLQYPVFKEPWADASNTLRRERIDAYLEEPP